MNSLKRDIKKADYYSEIKHYCKCGHSMIIPEFVDKKICSWCGQYVFRTKKIEFDFRIKEALKRGNKNVKLHETFTI